MMHKEIPNFFPLWRIHCLFYLTLQILGILLSLVLFEESHRCMQSLLYLNERVREKERVETTGLNISFPTLFTFNSNSLGSYHTILSPVGLLKSTGCALSLDRYFTYANKISMFSGVGNLSNPLYTP